MIDSLPAELRDLFSIDPVLFMQTVGLPADVRRLLETVQPASSSLSIGGQFGRGRLSFSPNFSLLSDTLNGSAPRRSYSFGYSSAWQFARSWQLHSALSNRVFYAGTTPGFRRTNVLTFGLDKSLSGLPGWISPASSKSTVEGWVFRDNGINGVLDANDPGLSGIRVRLDGKQIVATDNNGHFRFKGVSPGRHHLSLDLAQFPGRVRVTTPSELDVEVIDRNVQVNFGIVNFARVIGTVFSDYHNDASRQSDAPGLPRVRVRLAAIGFATEVISDNSGDYEAADLPPGDYAVTIAAEDLPANYVAPGQAQQVHIEPLATAVADLPVRALRSISGRVLLKTGPDAAPKLEPIAGVTVIAGGSTATTDAEGRYALRDLPVGAIEIRVVPVPRGAVEPPRAARRRPVDDRADADREREHHHLESELDGIPGADGHRRGPRRRRRFPASVVRDQLVGGSAFCHESAFEADPTDAAGVHRPDRKLPRPAKQQKAEQGQAPRGGCHVQNAPTLYTIPTRTKLLAQDKGGPRDACDRLRASVYG